MLGRKTYLGNSVYAEYTGDGIQLTSNNGTEGRQSIFLDNAVINKFDKFKHDILRWLDTVKKQMETKECT